MDEVPVLFGHVEEGDAREDAGVVDQDVDFAEGGDGCVDQGAGGAGGGDIAREQACFAAGCSYFCRDLFGGGLVIEVVDGDVGAGLREGDRDGPRRCLAGRRLPARFDLSDPPRLSPVHVAAQHGRS